MSKAETDYIANNNAAINTEAEKEHKCLADRLFRIYRGCTLVLRGKDWFLKEKALKWRVLIDALIHAILMNDVDVRFVDHANEEHVQVHPVANPVVQTQMLEATRKLPEHWGEENFDAICRGFENQETAIPSGSRAKFVSQTIRRPGSPPKGSRKLLQERQRGMQMSGTGAAIQLVTHSFSLVVRLPGMGNTRTIAATSMLVTQILGEGSLIGAFNTFNYNKRELMRLRGRADSDARLFAGVTTPFDDIEQLVDLAKEKPGKYRQFLEGIQSIRTSRGVKRNFKEFNIQRRELVKIVMKDVQDSGKFYTYLDKAERVLDEADVYATVSQ
ncbi:hypothetical protein HFD88_008265 [Aspergillus terreus]|nr:hypothetical protein HFD88_008265 [Aspergillus terreus]